MAETNVAQIVPVVQNIHGRPATTSRDVAFYFERRHVDVIDSIRTLQANCPESFSQRNFSLAEYIDEQGKPRPMFTLYRDGFMLLVMGYTGRKALAVKLAYIEAFNRMEADRRRAAREGAEAVLALPPFQREVLARLRRYAGMGLSCAELARLLGCGETSVKRSLRTARALGLAPQPPVQGSLLETAEEGGRHV